MFKKVILLIICIFSLVAFGRSVEGEQDRRELQKAPKACAAPSSQTACINQYGQPGLCGNVWTYVYTGKFTRFTPFTPVPANSCGPNGAMQCLQSGNVPTCCHSPECATTQWWRPKAKNLFKVSRDQFCDTIMGAGVWMHGPACPGDWSSAIIPESQIIAPVDPKCAGPLKKGNLFSSRPGYICCILVNPANQRGSCVVSH